MPYIKPADRPHLREIANEAIEAVETDGECNYLVSVIIRGLLKKRGINYQNMQNLDGCLGQIQAEFRRRIIGPYEDLKIKQNGDIDTLVDDIR